MLPEAMPSNKTHALAHATFYLIGDDIDPEFWTSYFGVMPSSTRTKGQLYSYPSGKLSTKPATNGFWAVGSKFAIRSDALTPHLRYLINLLALPRADFQEQMRAQNANLALWCYWLNEPGDRIPDVPDDIRTMIESMGGTIELDEYR
jgi:hypothetical protein